MHCIDDYGNNDNSQQPLPRLQERRAFGRSFAAGWVFVATGSGPLLLAGCGTKQAAPSPPPPAPTPLPPIRSAPVPAPAPAPSASPPPSAPSPAPSPSATGRAPRYVQLGPASASRNWDEVRLQAARRLVAAHPDSSYMGKPQPLLLAIPVLEIELNGDGSVRKINVLRQPSQATDTVQLAIDAIRRAAPFGDVSRLPRPWKFVETFLFNDDRRFKPRTLDQ